MSKRNSSKKWLESVQLILPMIKQGAEVKRYRQTAGSDILFER